MDASAPDGEVAALGFSGSAAIAVPSDDEAATSGAGGAEQEDVTTAVPADGGHGVEPSGHGAGAAFGWRRWAAVLGVAVAGPIAGLYLVASGVLVVVTGTGGGGYDVMGVLRTAAAVWPALYQVPVTVVGAPLGVLPLAPTAVLMGVVAAAAGMAMRRLGGARSGSPGADLRRDGVRRRGGDVWWVVAAFAAGHGLVGVVLAVVRPAEAVSVSPWSALFGCAAVGGVAAALGAMVASGPARLVRERAPGWMAEGVLAGLAGVAALLVAGAAVTVVSLVVSAATVRELFVGWPAQAWLGLSLLSVAYVPNAVVAGLAWLVGPGFSVGTVVVSPFGATAGTLPAVPLLAAMPEPGDAPWRAVVFVLPLLAGLLVGRLVRDACRVGAVELTERLHAVVLAGTVASAVCFVLAAVTGGRLGGGVFDPVRIPPASVAIAVFGWLVVPAAVYVAITDRPQDAGAETVSEPDKAGVDPS